MEPYAACDAAIALRARTRVGTAATCGAGGESEIRGFSQALVRSARATWPATCHPRGRWRGRAGRAHATRAVVVRNETAAGSGDGLRLRRICLPGACNECRRTPPHIA